MSDRWVDGGAYDAFMGRWSQALAAPFLRWASFPPDAEVLDVGCGTGSLSRALVANGASRVVGVDASPTLVAHASSLARAAGNDGASFEVGDAAKLRFADGEFDAVVSSLALNFFPTPGMAVSEMRRVVRDGGVVAASVWDYSGGMQMLRRFWDAAKDLRLPMAHEMDEGVRFPECDPYRLLELFGGIGSSPETTHLEVPMEFRDFADYWDPFLTAIGPSGEFVAGLAEPQRVRLREQLRSRLPADAEGRIRLISKAWAVRATKA